MTANELYTPEWHQWHADSYNEWSTRALFGVFAHLGIPLYMLDLGCADGHLVKVAAMLTEWAMGVDIAVETEVTEDYALFRGNLAEPLKNPNIFQFDLVLSWEVAEHLPADAADGFCDTLANAVEAGGHLVFTAAVPGQGGTGHINEQPHEYWRKKLFDRGLLYEPELTEALRATWAKTTGPCWWYPQNVQVFTK